MVIEDYNKFNLNMSKYNFIQCNQEDKPREPQIERAVSMSRKIYWCNNLKKEYEEEIEDLYTNPDDEDSTELGEVPQAKKKGAIDPNYKPYNLLYRF